MRQNDVLSLTEGGPVWRLARRMEWVRPDTLGLRQVALCVAITWAPQGVLALLSGHLRGRSVLGLWATSYANHARLLIAVPLLLLADPVVDARVQGAWRRFRDELVAAAHQPRLRALRDGIDRLARSSGAELAIGILAYVLVAVRCVEIRVIHDGGWFDTSTPLHTGHLTLPGIWAAAVSLPLFYFLCLRWLWRYGLWVVFLLGVAAMRLRLIPAHADRAGGLGFLGETQSAFAMIPLATSAVIAGTWADEILRGRGTLAAYRDPVALLLVATLLIFLSPLAAYSHALRQLRLEPVGRFDDFSGALARAFEQKWLLSRDGPSPLTPDVSALTDVSTAFEVAHAVRLVPFRARLVRLYVVVTLLPMLFPLLTSVPLFKLAGKLLKAIA